MVGPSRAAPVEIKNKDAGGPVTSGTAPRVGTKDTSIDHQSEEYREQAIKTAEENRKLTALLTQATSQIILLLCELDPTEHHVVYPDANLSCLIHRGDKEMMALDGYMPRVCKLIDQMRAALVEDTADKAKGVIDASVLTPENLYSEIQDVNTHCEGLIDSLAEKVDELRGTVDDIDSWRKGG
jgi:hypothetical protein